MIPIRRSLLRTTIPRTTTTTSLLLARPRISPSSSSSTSHNPIFSRSLATAVSSSPSESAANPTPDPDPKKKPKARFYTRHPVLTTLLLTPPAILTSLILVTLSLLAFDASTYSETNRHNLRDNVPFDPLKLRGVNERRGGKKGLLVADVMVDDEEELERKSQGKGEKKKLVIIGGGWGVSYAAAGPLALAAG